MTAASTSAPSTAHCDNMFTVCRIVTEDTPLIVGDMTNVVESQHQLGPRVSAPTDLFLS